jgi:hypothetical protein
MILPQSRSFVWLCSLASVVAGTLASAGLAHAESDTFCKQYAQTAVDAYRENVTRDCRFGVGARWQDNFDKHFSWCRNAPNLWAKREEEYRANKLAVCRHEPKAAACHDYALLASGQQMDSERSNCGFTGGRWHDDYDAHLSWCLHEASVEAAQREVNIRRALLGICWREADPLRCDGYAHHAQGQAQEAAARQCGFTGPRWTASYDDHLLWCYGQPPEAAEAETSEREGPLSQCRTTNPLPGGPPAPPSEACEWTATLQNQACLNLDGTPSSITPGSMSAPACGGTAEIALERAKVSFAANMGCLSEGGSPAPGCCTYTQETTQGCGCQ